MKKKKINKVEIKEEVKEDKNISFFSDAIDNGNYIHAYIKSYSSILCRNVNGITIKNLSAYNKIIVKPREVVYVPTGIIEISGKYKLKVFDKIKTNFALAIDQLTDGSIALENVTDTEKTLFDEAIIATISFE